VSGAGPGRITEEHRYAATPAEVLAALTDRDFLTGYAAELGARLDGVAVSGEDGATHTELRLGVPTRGIPPAFARFVGAEVAVRDVRSWRSDRAGGFAADTEVRARIFGRDAVVLGTSTLTPDADGAPATTLAVTRARVSVDAPLVGRQAESAVAQLVTVVLLREAELLRRRLAGSGRASSSP